MHVARWSLNQRELVLVAVGHGRRSPCQLLATRRARQDHVHVQYAAEQTFFLDEYVFRDGNAGIGGDDRANSDVAGISKLPDSDRELTADLC